MDISEIESRKERVDAILAPYTVVGRCISCRGEIMKNQEIIKTIHGDYHGAPRRCVEGRSD